MPRKKSPGSVAEQRERIGPKVPAALARKRIQELTQDLRTRNTRGNSRGSRTTPSRNKR